jgi:hypothetical protein
MQLSISAGRFFFKFILFVYQKENASGYAHRSAHRFLPRSPAIVRLEPATGPL